MPRILAQIGRTAPAAFLAVLLLLPTRAAGPAFRWTPRVSEASAYAPTATGPHERSEQAAATRGPEPGGNAQVPEEGGPEAEFELPSFVLHHLADSRTLDLAPFGEIHLPEIRIGPLDLSITKHVLFLWIAAAIMLAIFVPMGWQRGSVYRGLYNLMEALVVYVRDQVAFATIPREKAVAYVPYLLTLFFFILFANLLGLVPYGATATSNWMVTGSLAVLTMIMAEGSSLAHLGVRGFLRQFLPIELHAKSLVGKVGNLALAVLLVPIEITTHVGRIAALMIRLWANMIAGHLLIFAMIGLIFFFKSYLLAPASVGFSAAVYLLEIFIALVQAFIFTILTALFIGLGVQEHH